MPDRPVCVGRTIAVSIVRRGPGTASGRAPGQSSRCVWVGSSGAASVMVDHGRAAGRRGRKWGRRELEHRGRRGGGTATCWIVGRSGHAQRRTSRRRVIRRGRRTGGAWWRLVVGVRGPVDVSQIAADDGSRFVGRFGAGRPSAWLMVVRHGRSHRLLLLTGRAGNRSAAGDHATGTARGSHTDAAVHSAATTGAVSAGHVYGWLRPRRAQREVRLRVFGKRRLGRADFARRIGATERAHRAAVRRHNGRGKQQVDETVTDVRKRRWPAVAATLMGRPPSSLQR